MMIKGGYIFLVALAGSVLLHLSVGWGTAVIVGGLGHGDADALAQLDVSSVELSMSEEEDQVAVPQVAIPSPPPQGAPRPPPPGIESPDPPPMERLPDADALLVVRRSEGTRLPDDLRPDMPEPEFKSKPELPPPTEPSPAAASAAPLQARVDAPPAPQRTIRPRYPEGSRQRREEGDVTLEFSVDEEGRVTEVKVVEARSVPFAELRESAVSAVRRARFRPARAGDRPVAATARLTLNFRLKD